MTTIGHPVDGGRMAGTGNGHAPRSLLYVKALLVAEAIATASGGQYGTGRLVCPVCARGTVAYSIGAVHVAAACSTPGCVAFHC